MVMVVMVVDYRFATLGKSERVEATPSFIKSDKINRQLPSTSNVTALTGQLLAGLISIPTKISYSDVQN